MPLLLVLLIMWVVSLLVYLDPKIVAKPFNLLSRSLDSSTNDVFVSTKFKLGEDIKSRWKDIRDDYKNQIQKKNKNNIYSRWERKPQRFWEGWYNVSYRLFGHDHPNFAKMNPTLYSLIKDHPEIHTASISCLTPGKNIDPHEGPYEGLIRYHLGLDVPDNDCFIQIKDSRHYWKNGEPVMFNDCHTHFVQNPKTDKNGIPVKHDRLILFLDVKKTFKSRLLNFLNELNLKSTSLIPVSCE